MFLVLFRAPFLPFTIALCLSLALVGASVFGRVRAAARGAVPSGAAGAHRVFDVAPGTAVDTGRLIAASDAIYHDSAARPAVPLARLWALLGCPSGPTPGKVALCLGLTGVAGIVLQQAAVTIVGAPMPLWGAVGAALMSGVLLSCHMTLGRTANAQACGGLRGVVTRGDARAGVAAQVTLRTFGGESLSAWCEPLDPDDVIAEGSAVLTVRVGLPGDRAVLRILPLD